MIILYTWTTPNGYKASIMLEELGLPYRVVPVNIARDEQHAPDFLKVSPNNKIPAIVDEDAPGGPLAVFESGAILIYLAEKTGRLLAPAGAERYKALEWLQWQVGGLGPMLGQLNFFARRSPERAQLAIGRFAEESRRLLGVMERRLQEAPYLGGHAYSIADIACYGWAKVAVDNLGEVLAPASARIPAVRRWLAEIGARPAVRRGMAIPAV